MYGGVYSLYLNHSNFSHDECASHGSIAGSAIRGFNKNQAETPSSHPNKTLILEEQMAALHPAQTLLGISRLRPTAPTKRRGAKSTHVTQPPKPLTIQAAEGKISSSLGGEAALQNAEVVKWYTRYVQVVVLARA